MGVKGGVREDVCNYASCEFSGSLILLQDDIDLDSRANALSVLAVHQASGYIGGTVKCKEERWRVKHRKCLEQFDLRPGTSTEQLRTLELILQ